MPRKKTVIEEFVNNETETVDALKNPAATNDVRNEDESLSAFLSGVGCTIGRISIYRARKHTGRPAFVGSCLAEELTESYIQDTYGGGTYFIKLLDDHSRFVKQKTIEIESRVSANPPQQQPQIEPTQPPQTFSEISLLREQVSRMQELMLEMIRNRETSPAPTMPEVIAAVAQLHSMAPKQPDNSAALVTALTKGIELAGKLGGNSGGWSDTIKELISSLPTVLASMKQPAVEETAVTTHNHEQYIQEKARERMGAMLRQGIAYLKQKALKNSDVDLWIDFIADNAEDPAWQPFISVFMNDTFENLIEKLDPELKQPAYNAWFRRLYDGLREVFSGGATEREPSNDIDATDDGASDKIIGEKPDGKTQSANAGGKRS